MYLQLIETALVQDNTSTSAQADVPKFTIL